MFTQYLRRYWGLITLGLISLILVDTIQLFIPRVIKYAIDSLTTGEATFSLLLKYASTVFLLAIGILVFRFGWRYFIFGTARRVERDLRRDLFAHLESLHLHFYKDHKVGTLMAHLTNDLDAVVMAIGIGLVTAVDAVLWSSFTIIFMLLINVQLTLYVIIPLPLLAYLTFYFSRQIFTRFERVQSSFANLTSTVQEQLTGIHLIKAYNETATALDKLKRSSLSYVSRNLSFIKVYALFFPLVFFIANISLALLLWLGGKSTILGTITIGDFVAFQTYLGMLMWPIMGLGYTFTVLQRGRASWQRLYKLFATKPAIKSPPHPVKPKHPIGNLAFHHVYFAYPDQPTHYVLKDINLEIPKGTFLGIAGEIGSGKSTLALLLARMYDPTDGRITFDGIDLRELDLQFLRRFIVHVPQQTFLFSTTIRDNIAFGNPTASDEAITHVCKLAQIYDEIMEFEDGLNTVVGEKGVTLSGGQRQRITLARALLMEPEILVLDDPFSSVDSEHEVKIIKSLCDHLRGKTLILISHRLNSMRFMDKIIVLKDGTIVETGSFNELLLREGVFFDLYRKQQLKERIWKNL